MLLAKAILIVSVLYPGTWHLWQPVLFTTVGRLGNLTKWRPAASDLIIVSLVVVIVHFLNCFNNFSRFRYSYMYIMMFITYICIFSDKLPSHIQTFGLLLILLRFIGLQPSLPTREECISAFNKVGALGRHLGDEIQLIQMFCPPSEETPG